MARILSDDEIVWLLAMPEEEANAWIDAQIPSFTDSIVAKTTLIRMRRYPSNAPVPGSETGTLAGLGVGTGLGAVAVNRVLELVKGQTIAYEARLEVTEIVARLKNNLDSREFRIVGAPSSIAIARQAGSHPFCMIRLSVNDDKTAVTVSGLNLDEVKQGASGVVDSLFNLGRRAVQGRNVVEGALDVLGGAVEIVGQAGSDLNTANKIADTIEKYGAEVERATVEAARKVAVKVAEEKELKQKENNCTFCGSARTLGQACPSCGATETA